MTLEIKKCKYEGMLFGINYQMDFDTDEEFVEWFIGKLKQGKNYELFQKIITALLNESPEFTALKDKVNIQ